MHAGCIDDQALLGWQYIHGGPVRLPFCPCVCLSHTNAFAHVFGCADQILLDYEAALFDSKALSTFSFDSDRGCFFLSDGSAGEHAAGPGPVPGPGRRSCPLAIHHAGRKEQLPQFRSVMGREVMRRSHAIHTSPRDQLRTWRLGADRSAHDAFFAQASVFVDGVATPFRSICSAEPTHPNTRTQPI